MKWAAFYDEFGDKDLGDQLFTMGLFTTEEQRRAQWDEIPPDMKTSDQNSIVYPSYPEILEEEKEERKEDESWISYLFRKLNPFNIF